MYPSYHLVTAGPNKGLYARGHLPPGYRFCPTDPELINEYLKKFISFELTQHSNIEAVNVYMYTPRNLSEAYPCLGDNIWYFFSPRDRKRLYRVCANGYWKYYGTKQPIYHNGIRIGYKNSLIFYEGEPPNGRETIWVMKEYIADPPTLPDDSNDAVEDDVRDDYVLYQLQMRTTIRRPSRNKYKQLLSTFAKLRITGQRAYYNKKLAAQKRRKTERQGRRYNILAPHSLTKSIDFWRGRAQ